MIPADWGNTATEAVQKAQKDGLFTEDTASTQVPSRHTVTVCCTGVCLTPDSKCLEPKEDKHIIQHAF